MSTQVRPAAAATTDKIPAKMKLQFHVYPDARSTTKRSYCSAWSRRYGRSARA
ncbi:MAG: hypothetical protein ACHQ2Z_15810 [Elusimicrobiota bacterium]